MARIDLSKFPPPDTQPKEGSLASTLRQGPKGLKTGESAGPLSERIRQREEFLTNPEQLAVDKGIPMTDKQQAAQDAMADEVRRLERERGIPEPQGGGESKG